jgi:hypothetical protein
MTIVPTGGKEGSYGGAMTSFAEQYNRIVASGGPEGSCTYILQQLQRFSNISTFATSAAVRGSLLIEYHSLPQKLRE